MGFLCNPFFVNNWELYYSNLITHMNFSWKFCSTSILSFENTYSCLLSECFSGIRSSEVLKLHQPNCSQDLKRSQENKTGMGKEGSKKVTCQLQVVFQNLLPNLKELVKHFMAYRIQTVKGLHRKCFCNRKVRLSSFVKVLLDY